MTNPERVNKATPNGGDYSEFWYTNKDGEPVERKEDATHFKILEMKNSGELVNTIYGILKK